MKNKQDLDIFPVNEEEFSEIFKRQEEEFLLSIIRVQYSRLFGEYYYD